MAATHNGLAGARARLGRHNAVLVHDYLLVMRGAERTFAKMCDLLPGAPIATLLYQESIFKDRLAGHEVRTSPLQRLAARQDNFRWLFPLMPVAAQNLDVRGHDLVLSSSSAFAHGVRPDPDATHVCLCHTPFRYAWTRRDDGLAMMPRSLRRIGDRALEAVRRWDLRAAQSGTHYLAVGRLSQQYMRDFWGIDAPIVRQPVDLGRFAPAPEREDYALVVGELISHKRVEDALKVAQRAGVRVKVVGDGPEAPRLKALYGDIAEFLGRTSDEELAELYSKARVLIMAAMEEFGLTAVEAQASGCPVLSFAHGGVLETVFDGVTGILVEPGNHDAMVEVLRSGELERLSPAAMRMSANRFSIDAFYEDLVGHVLDALGERRPAPAQEPAAVLALAAA